MDLRAFSICVAHFDHDFDHWHLTLLVAAGRLAAPLFPGKKNLPLRQDSFLYYVYYVKKSSELAALVLF